MQRRAVALHRILGGGNLFTVIVVLSVIADSGEGQGIDTGPGGGVERQLRHVVAAGSIVAVNQLGSVGRDTGEVRSEFGGGHAVAAVVGNLHGVDIDGAVGGRLVQHIIAEEDGIGRSEDGRV